MADIASILDVHPDVDLKRIRHWVREFSAAIEMPEIYDDMERILTQQKKVKKISLPNINPKSRHRY